MQSLAKMQRRDCLLSRALAHSRAPLATPLWMRAVFKTSWIAVFRSMFPEAPPAGAWATGLSSLKVVVWEFVERLMSTRNIKWEKSTYHSASDMVTNFQPAIIIIWFLLSKIQWISKITTTANNDKPTFATTRWKRRMYRKYTAWCKSHNIFKNVLTTKIKKNSITI